MGARAASRGAYVGAAAVLGLSIAALGLVLGGMLRLLAAMMASLPSSGPGFGDAPLWAQILIVAFTVGCFVVVFAAVRPLFREMLAIQREDQVARGLTPLDWGRLRRPPVLGGLAAAAGVGVVVALLLPGTTEAAICIAAGLVALTVARVGAALAAGLLG
jgi:hypothetical protein